MIEIVFIENIRIRLINISVGASALRNQGSSGIVETTRIYFQEKIKLKELFHHLPRKTFKNYLNRHTENLLSRYPNSGKSWGAARKGLNLYFRELVYNKFICEYYNLPKSTKSFSLFISNLEVPLDKDVAMGINKDTQIILLKWKGIRYLNSETSNSFQEAAQIIADAKRISRVHLDLEYWRKRSKTPKIQGH